MAVAKPPENVSIFYCQVCNYYSQTLIIQSERAQPFTTVTERAQSGKPSPLFICGRMIAAFPESSLPLSKLGGVVRLLPALAHKAGPHVKRTASHPQASATLTSATNGTSGTIRSNASSIDSFTMTLT